MAHISIFASRKVDSAAAAAAACGGGGGVVVSRSATASAACNCGLGRLMRKLRKQSRMLCVATKPAATFRCQYDPLSYSRNFDRNGFGTAIDDDSAHFYYSFSSRFVNTSSSSSSSKMSSAAAAGLVAANP